MKWGRSLRGLRRSRDPQEESLWPRALSAGRAQATALTLLLLMLALTANDLRLFRFPAAFAGGALSVVVFAATPPIFASRLVARALSDAPQAAMTWMESALLRRRAFLGIAIAALVLWLVFFSSGRTPRW